MQMMYIVNLFLVFKIVPFSTVRSLTSTARHLKCSDKSSVMLGYLGRDGAGIPLSGQPHQNRKRLLIVFERWGRVVPVEAVVQAMVVETCKYNKDVNSVR